MELELTVRCLVWTAPAQNAVPTFHSCLSNQHLVVTSSAQIAIVLSARVVMNVHLVHHARCSRLTSLVGIVALRSPSSHSSQVVTNLYTARTASWHVAVNTNITEQSGKTGCFFCVLLLRLNKICFVQRTKNKEQRTSQNVCLCV